ncbi:MAG: hypothetical protein EZS28_002714 [Streblomastix strix]|uniref:Protein kinase domain-containing protein n=1 Tax=Streblomastix strix TaxID=222440 RepID=A0A5J4X374_9EUKA|nr:MAG: hypothetical protein EZS28_002714 [Streblomastix strix]
MPNENFKQYVSPELLIEKKFRMSSDVWGIGATIFTLINRRPPFSGTCDELQYNIIAEEKFPDPIIDIYSQRLRDTVMAMLIKNRKKRITMNILVTIPEIRERIDKYAGEMLETSEGYLKGYLERLINNVDTAPASLPKNGLIKSNILSIDQQQIDPDNVRFEIKDDQIAEQYPGAPGQSIVKLIQLKQKLNNIITISPVINKGDGVVRIQLKFNDNGSQDMNDRCFGIIDASYSIPDKFQLGFNKESALYRGKEIIDKYSGKVFHMNSESGNQVFETSDKFKNDDIITAEVNMHLEKEERTLHFFVNNQWQNCSFQNLPDSIKFCVQLSYANTSVSILSMEKLPNPTENKNIKSICEIIW